MIPRETANAIRVLFNSFFPFLVREGRMTPREPEVFSNHAHSDYEAVV